ncbi:MAG: S8 family serine peptidase [Chloroflexi bacterium]|nr:S8 family serine peptidase [Chloroflexota bacterium]
MGLAVVLIAILLIFIFTLAPAPEDTTAAANVHPALLAMAAEQPDTAVRVIIQKGDNEADIAAAVTQLGGQVIKDLRIINAIVAEMEAETAVDLSYDASVNWVSLDGAVESAGKPPKNGDGTTGNGVERISLSDEFETATYEENGFDKPWATPWVEDDPTGQGPLGGSIYIADGELRLQDNPDSGTTPSIYREVDLGHAIGQEASLFFIFKFVSEMQASPLIIDDAQDSVALEISADGGQSYEEIARFYPGQNGMFTEQIGDYISPHTRIRFRVMAGLDHPDAYFAVEAIQVSYDGNPLSDGTAYNFYLDTLNVPQVWDMGYAGDGIGVVIVDSGVNKMADFGRRIQKAISFNPNSNTINDVNGHGTHVAGIVGGNGAAAYGRFTGIAPEVDIYSLKISDETGMAYESDLVDAMQWILDYKDRYNLRVVNLSVNSAVESSYHTSPVNAAAEILWFNGIVIVASAGNSGNNPHFNAINTAPANDPFIITVGASHDKETVDRTDDRVTPFSAYGMTMDGFAKPDIIAPGKNIISLLSGQSSWYAEHTERVVHEKYFRISGTSMSAPMVTGAAALLLQAEPDLTPDQVKYRLMHSGSGIAGVRQDPNVYPYLDVYAALTTPTTESANTGIEASKLLWTGDNPVQWGSVNWGSVNWGSVNWGSVNWGSVNWGSVNWGSVNWDD